MSVASAIILLLPLVSSTHAANILVYMPSIAPSHFKPFQPLFVELAKRGHDVTVYSVFPMEKNIDNYTNIMPHSFTTVDNLVPAEMRHLSRWRNIFFMYNVLQPFMEKIMKHPITQDLIKSNSKFDLIFTELYWVDTAHALGHRFDAPVVGLSVQPLFPVYSWIFRNPFSFSYIPHMYLPYTDEMDFFQRVMNTFYGFITFTFFELYARPNNQKQMETVFGRNYTKDKVDFRTMMLNTVSLILVDSHFTVGYVKPNLPNVIDVAGIHLNPVKPLPKNIQSFMDKANDGAIFVSLGTLIEPEAVPELGIKLTNVFRKLPHKILWKWNPNLLSNIPDNVLVLEWMPQNDILQHPKCKLFITHGGYHSIIEAVNAGVPLLGYPFFTDQYYNIAMADKFGIGKRIDLENADEAQLISTIKEFITDERYRQNIQLRSTLFKDRPDSPVNTAVYWSEYLIRHKNTSHLKSAATSLAWYQYFLLDVILFFLVTLIISIYVMRYVIKRLLSLSFKKSSVNIKIKGE